MTTAVTVPIKDTFSPPPVARCFFATAAGLADAPSLCEHGRRCVPATVRLGGWHPAVHVQVGPHGSPGSHAPLLAGVCGKGSCVCTTCVCVPFVWLRHGEGCRVARKRGCGGWKAGGAASPAVRSISEARFAVMPAASVDNVLYDGQDQAKRV